MNKKTIVKVFFTSLLIILLGTFTTIIVLNPKSAQVNEPDLVGTVLAYAAQPFFSNENILEQIYNIDGLKLEIYDVDDREIYFSTPLSVRQQLIVMVDDPSKIVYATRFSNGVQELGDYRYRNPNRNFFMIPKEDIRVDPSKTVSMSLFDNQIIFPFTLEELSNTMGNVYTYNGYLYILQNVLGKTHRIVNHSAYISKHGDHGLLRLVNKISDNSESKEDLIQKLLHFVSYGIEWNDHGISNKEIMKRPIEILLSGKADCSGKTTLFASLLEQIDVDYVLVYYDNHINVAVKSDFKNWNSRYLDLTTGRYFIAETTIPGFIIGETPIIKYREPRFIQSPGGPAYDYNTGEKLEFLK